MDVVLSVCIVTRGAVATRVWEVRMFHHADVVCLCPVAILTAAFCMTCSLLMLVEDVRGEHVKEAYYIAGLMAVLLVAMSVSFCLTAPVAVSIFIICSGLCACIEKL